MISVRWIVLVLVLAIATLSLSIVREFVDADSPLRLFNGFPNFAERAIR